LDAVPLAHRPDHRRRLRFVRGRRRLGSATISAGLGFDRIRLPSDFACNPIERPLAGALSPRVEHPRRSGSGDVRALPWLGHWLCLERLERAQAARELGERGAAVAQQRLERARAIAVADDREPGAAARVVALGEHLDLDALGPGATSRTSNSSLSSSGRSTCLPALSPCLSAFRDARALPSDVLGPRDLAPFFRLASARALLTKRPRGARRLHWT
jgi:hypothetical protein